MRSKRWSERENIFLLEHSYDMTTKELSRNLNRTRCSITEHAYKLQIKLYQVLTPKTEELILSNTHLTNKMLSTQLNISESLVETTLHHHNIKKDIYIKDITELSATTKHHPYRRIMEKHIGRKLNVGEHVHHIDMDKTNNDITNLFLFNGNTEHQLCHGSLNKIVKKLLSGNIIKFINGEYVMIE